MVSVPVLVVTGPVGVGKTAVAAAASGLLDGAGMPHALVEMDWLGWLYPGSPRDPFRTSLGLENLAAVWANYRAAGAERLILVGIAESRDTVTEYLPAVPDAAFMVARLRAPIPTIHRRLEGRETGEGLTWHRQRATELSELMEANGVGDVLLDTEGRAVEDIADELLRRIGWVTTK